MPEITYYETYKDCPKCGAEMKIRSEHYDPFPEDDAGDWYEEYLDCSNPDCLLKKYKLAGESPTKLQIEWDDIFFEIPGLQEGKIHGINTIKKQDLYRDAMNEDKIALIKAINLFNKAISYNYRNWEPEKVQSFYEKILKLQPRGLLAVIILNNIAAKYGWMHNFEMAKKFLDDALSLDTNSAITNFNLGVYYDRIGNKTEAANYIKKAREIDPDSYDLRIIPVMEEK